MKSEQKDIRFMRHEEKQTNVLVCAHIIMHLAVTVLLPCENFVTQTHTFSLLNLNYLLN